ncbi:60S ribosomal protein L13-1-like protein [Tanacetum coccineum]|uniref:60S ribosomal protein L13-1-like protein n=1 Tax=Tanacetum coccineum TaxID=301880 RepID=A0ABQ4WVA3_9ASTR
MLRASLRALLCTNIVDHRRINLSLEGLQANVQRLKTFKAKLVIFPRRARKMKVQGPVLPIVREKPAAEFVKVTEEMKSFSAFSKLRLERTNKDFVAGMVLRAQRIKQPTRSSKGAGICAAGYQAESPLCNE